MHFSTIAASLLASTSVAAASPPASQHTSASHGQCGHSMDGKLPSTVPSDFHFSGNVRRYYVAAEEVEWNFAPTGWDNWMGVPIDLSPRAKRYTTHNTTYLKALYRGYTDSSFSQKTEQPPWQGTQGPTLRAEVGDMIEIMFVNKMSRNYATMHSMGLAYSKMSEGADYPGQPMAGKNSSIPLGDAVPPVDGGIGPGECVVYKWLASDIAGPNDGEPARAHSYHSYVDLRTDTISGLIGPQIIYAPGQMEATMKEYKEFTLLFMIYREGTSFLSGDNARKLSSNHSADPTGMFGNINNDLWGGNNSIWHPQAVNLNDSGRFSSADNFHSMNGYIYANNPPFEMCQDDKAIWYASGYGEASHAFHMHGNSVVDAGRKQFSVSLNDGVSKTLYMNATGVGLWQVICHVNDHHQNGMVSNYLVHPKGSGSCSA